MLPAESVECLQACTVTLDPGSDLLGPSVGIVGVLVGGFIGFLGLRWQHRQSHPQFVLKEIARMTSALRDGYEIAGSLRGVVTDKQGMDAAIDKLKTLAATTGPVAATIGLVSPGPVADKAWHVDAMLNSDRTLGEDVFMKLRAHPGLRTAFGERRVYNAHLAAHLLVARSSLRMRPRSRWEIMEGHWLSSAATALMVNPRLLRFWRRSVMSSGHRSVLAP
jgi:hypothetical protein